MIKQLLAFIKANQIKEKAGIFVVIEKEDGHMDSYLVSKLGENSGNLELTAKEKDRFICPCCEAEKIAEAG